MLLNCRSARSNSDVADQAREILNTTLNARRHSNGSSMTLRGERNFIAGRGNFAYLTLTIHDNILRAPNVAHINRMPGRYEVRNLNRWQFIIIARNEGDRGDHSEEIVFNLLEEHFISRGVDFTIDYIFSEREPCRDGHNCYRLIEQYLEMYGSRGINTSVRYLEDWHTRAERKTLKESGIPRHVCGSEVRKYLNRHRKPDDDGSAGGAGGGSGSSSAGWAY